MTDKLQTVKIQAIINGKSLSSEAHPMMRLLDVLREELNLLGTKEGCGEGECGACAILLNDKISR